MELSVERASSWSLDGYPEVTEPRPREGDADADAEAVARSTIVCDPNADPDRVASS